MSFKYTPTTLKKLEQLLDEVRYIVRYEKGNFTSGYCVLEERKVVVVNKFLNVEGRINALLEIIPNVKLKEEELSYEMMKLWNQIKNNIIVDDDPSFQSQMEL
jgi:hypothetical protein